MYIERDNKMRENKLTFKKVYLIYVGVLVLLVISAVFYVRSLLNEYEKSQPEYYIEQTIEDLLIQAGDGSFWEHYTCPNLDVSSWEEGKDIKSEYLSLYDKDLISYAPRSGFGEDELVYDVLYNKVLLAEVKLKATSPAVTKLAVFSMRDWAVESIVPILQPQEIKLEIPSDFSLSVNDHVVGIDEGTLKDGLVAYVFSGIYLPLELDIRDSDGNIAEYYFQDGQVLIQSYHYVLTLPAEIRLVVNGEINEGTLLLDGRIKYVISRLVKPEVMIFDNYGHDINYENGVDLPLINMLIQAPEDYSVQVNGEDIPEEAISVFDQPDYIHLADYLPRLPKFMTYRIVVLDENPAITVKDMNGETIQLAEGQYEFDFSNDKNTLQEIPDQVSGEIDVLEVVQNWSLFMSDDMNFSQIKEDLLKDSYQYQVAQSYAIGIDIQFVSNHVLLNPTFTENKVTNFVWITDDCFSVDISFVKNMQLNGGLIIEDSMNERFYFVRHDDSNDAIDNPTWKLASMKEVL